MRGRVEVRWERCNEGIILNLSIPEGVNGKVIPPIGYAVDGEMTKEAKTGSYYFVRKGAC